MTEDECEDILNRVPLEHRAKVMLETLDSGYGSIEWLEKGGMEWLYEKGYLPKKRVRHPDLDRGRYIVPKDLLADLQRIAVHKDVTVKRLITTHLNTLVGSYRNLPKLPVPPPPPPPPPPEDINPLFSEYQREWIKGHAYCEKRGTDHLGQKYTNERWLDSVLQNMEKELITGQRPVKAANGTIIGVRVHAGDGITKQPILPSDQLLTDKYNEWVNGGYQGPEPPRPYRNMEYYGFKKPKP